MTIVYGKHEISVSLTKGNVHISDSYRVTKRADMNALVKLIRAEAERQGFRYSRSNSSWVTEWAAHNYMHERGIQRSRTRSVDLDDRESRVVLAGYAAMAKLYRK